MRPKAPFVVLAAIMILAMGAVIVLVVESQGHAAAKHHTREFQEVVGGLGFGPALDLSRCPLSFDPRLCPRCTADLGPIPGGGFFCIHHACSILYYPALDRPAGH